jgi:hypothetical protein
MQQRLRMLIVLAAIAVVVIGLYIYLSSGNAFDQLAAQLEGEETPFPTPVVLLEETAGDSVTAFTVTNNETGESLEAALQDGVWVVVAAPEGTDTDLSVDTFRLENAAGTLLSTTSITTLEDVTGLAQYGLESPAYTIEFETALAREQTLFVGDLNPGGMMYYVQVPDDDRVFMVNQFSLNSVTGLVDEPPFVIPTPDLEAGITPIAEP